MKRSILPVLLISVGLGAGVGQAAVITDFNSYALSTGSAPTFTNGVQGQDGWSNTSSNGTGYILSTNTSGEYVGGRAAAGSNVTDASSYIGGKAGTLLSSDAFTFDVYWAAGEAYVGGWADTTAVGTYANSEAGFLVGKVRQSSTPSDPDFIGIRGAGFGSSRIISPFGGALAASNNWYRIEASVSGLTVTLKARNLTTQTDVDFDPGAGTAYSWSTTLSAANFGAATSTYTGVTMRVTGQSAVDNINSGALLSAMVPEPASVALLLVGATGLLVRRRRR